MQLALSAILLEGEGGESFLVSPSLFFLLFFSSGDCSQKCLLRYDRAGMGERRGLWVGPTLQQGLQTNSEEGSVSPTEEILMMVVWESIVI